ncbi:MAG: hypothetical protein OEZ06_21920 [Myxococcales bacterium]|nr:hypothetical protein [Myxococcales bacterium]
MNHALSDRYIRRALREIAARDADVARTLKKVGYPPSRQRPAGFATLLRVIVGQQVSTSAARSIYGRLETALGPQAPAPRTLLGLSDEQLRAAGLSRSKVVYARALAEAIAAGELGLDDLPEMPDADVIERLTAVKGLGVWSAQMYLIFSLGRRDVWPAGDLGVRAGLQVIKGLAERPSAAQTQLLVEDYRPRRSVIALLAWACANAGVDVVG